MKNRPKSYVDSVVLTGPNVKHRLPHFGEIQDGCVYHTDLGQVAVQCWRAIPEHFPHTKTDEFIIMPDHMHGIIRIAGAQNVAPLQREHNTNTGATNKIPLTTEYR